MLSNIYKISPVFIKHFWVWLFKTARKILYFFFKNSETRHCEKQQINPKHFSDFQLKRRYGPLRHFCYAPYTSMFFSLHGKMAPCYATYNEKSDVFPDKNIKESWFNGSFARIRSAHAQCRFDEDCSFCFELFKNKAYGSMLQQKYEHYAFSKSKYPAIMEFELSNTCNLECIMCDANLSSSIKRRTQQKSVPDVIYGDAFVEQLKEFIPHLRMAEFTGGDPFLIEIYYHIWDQIITLNPGCDILITTNANTMNARIERLMARSKKLHFNVSVDAVSKKIYEEIRVNGKFENAMQNIDVFNAYCKKNKTSMNLLVCPMTVNRFEIPELIKFGNSKNIGVFFHTVVKPPHLSLKYQSPEFLNELIRYLKNFKFSTNTDCQKGNSINYLNLIKLLESWMHPDETGPAEQVPESSVDILYARIKQENNPEILKKTEALKHYFDLLEQTDEMVAALNIFDADYLYRAIRDKSVEDLIIFVKQELEKEHKVGK